ncbi:MAG TPA: DUF4886 domain-containing protein [Paludibacter sp.]|nr:MAG: hypothetical protein BWY08_00465 [Bacteroidetes bacterium ADurb.Bin174]HQB28242.1 DUF4886 domain-containing protein [Paludibacter sp.]
MYKNFLLSFLLLIVSCSSLNAKKIKLLAIGNSFSEDAVENNLYELVREGGDTIIVANMYIGGATLEQHANNANNNSSSYSYRKIVDGTRTVTANYTIATALADEDWDYISFQQASQLSGRYDSYFPHLTSLKSYVEARATNPNVQFVFHSTWAYAQNFNSSNFDYYNRNQMTMYNAIVDASHRAAEEAGISIVIPAGTAIQNGRSSSLGDTFCRDGFHLELNYGRYTVACTWYEKLFNKPVIGNEYKPLAVTPFQAKVAQHAAHYAVEKPKEITSLADLVDDTEKVPFTSRINLSFGSESSDPTWNSLIDVNLDAKAVDLRDIYGDITDVDAVITRRFGGINSSGPASTTTELNMPSDVTSKSFYGNKNQFGGVITPTAGIKFTSLDKNETYDFSIFASRMTSYDNKETYYKFSGKNLADTILYLDASNNSSKLVKAIGIAPNDNGEIELEIGPGPNNNNSYGFYYITALSFTPQNAMSGVNNLVRFSLNAYPNPFDKLLILYPDVDIENVKMMSLDGKVIHSVNNLACGNTHHINTEKIPSGVYIVSMTSNGVSDFLKLLKN